MSRRAPRRPRPYDNAWLGDMNAYSLVNIYLPGGRIVQGPDLPRPAATALVERFGCKVGEVVVMARVAYRIVHNPSPYGDYILHRA